MKKWFLLAACLLIALSFILLPFPASQFVSSRLKESTQPTAFAAVLNIFLAFGLLAAIFLLGIFLFFLKQKKNTGVFE